MTTTTIELDFDLCRQLILMLDEILLDGRHSRPRDYEFDGYSPETISYNAKQLGDAKLVRLKTAMNWYRGQLRYWPVWFNPSGEKFLAAAKDENVWQAALKAMESQSGPPSLKKLKAILFESATRNGV